jgi:hypothetical protein
MAPLVLLQLVGRVGIVLTPRPGDMPIGQSGWPCHVGHEPLTHLIRRPLLIATARLCRPSRRFLNW